MTWALNQLADADYCLILKIRPEQRQSWLTGAGPDDKYAVALREGEMFYYGPTLSEAICNAVVGPIQEPVHYA